MKKDKKVLVGTAISPLDAIIRALIEGAIKRTPKNMSEKEKKENDERFRREYWGC